MVRFGCHDVIVRRCNYWRVADREAVALFSHGRRSTVGNRKIQGQADALVIVYHVF